MSDIILRKEFQFHVVEAIKEEIRVNFKVYDINYYDENEVPVYLKEEPILNGSIKWDGCSDWQIPERLYFCSYAQIRDFGNLFEKMQEWAAELFPDSKFIV